MPTTHSDLILQHADRTAFVIKDNSGTTLSSVRDKRSVLEKAANLGISRWVHPILTYPLDPIILVEGKYDHAFVEQAVALLAPSTRIHVTYLEQLLSAGATGGVDHMIKYVRENSGALRTRVATARVIIVFDWESSGKKNEMDKHIASIPACKTFLWPETTFNPGLGSAFKGIERHMSGRIADEAERDVCVLGTKDDGSKTISSTDYPKFKEAAYKVVTRGLSVDDLFYSKPFLEELIRYAVGKP